MTDSGSTKSDIRSIVETMNAGFKASDERFETLVDRIDVKIDLVNARFEAVDKRFDDLIGQMNSRFNMMFLFMSAGFTILTVLLTLYRFLGLSGQCFQNSVARRLCRGNQISGRIYSR